MKTIAVKYAPGSGWYDADAPDGHIEDGEYVRADVARKLETALISVHALLMGLDDSDELGDLYAARVREELEVALAAIEYARGTP